MSLVGVGIDTLEVARVAGLLHRYGDAFVARWFTTAEAERCRRAGHDSSKAFASVLAGKEAVWKALRVQEHHAVPWRSIEIPLDADGGWATLRDDLARPGVEVEVRVEVVGAYAVGCAMAWRQRQAVATGVSDIPRLTGHPVLGAGPRQSPPPSPSGSTS